MVSFEYSMPFTKKEVRFLLSNGSPLSEAHKEKVKAELRANPAIGRAKKGSAAMKRPAKATISGHDWRERERNGA